MFLQRLMTKEAARYISLMCGVLVLAFNVVDILYWRWLCWGGENIFESLSVVKINSAVTLGLCSIAFLITRSETDHTVLNVIRYGCALVVVFFGVWTLLEYLYVAPFIIDQWLCSDTNIGIQNYPGRLSPNTALCLIIAGGLLSTINPRKPQHIHLVQTLTWVVITIAGFSLAGYLFGTEALYGISQATRMSPWTSMCFILLPLGILMLFPEQGLLAALADPGLSGRMLRQLLPTAVLAPIFLGWLQVKGLRAGFYEHEYGDVLMSLLTSMLLIPLILWSAFSIRRLEVERNVAIAQTEMSEARLKGILDNTPAVVFIKDEGGRYILVNRQFETLYHVRNEDMVGKTDYAVFPMEDADRFVADDQAVLNAGCAKQIEEPVTHDDGVHTFLTTKSPMWDPGRNRHVLCGIATDITIRKEAEDKLQEVARVKSDFASMVSHELRSPLTVIRGAIEIVDDSMAGPVTPDQKKHLEMALRNVDRLSRLITDVLDYQKMESGRVTYDIEPTNIVPVISDMLEGFRTVIDHKGLKLAVDLPKALPLVLCDADAFIQVVTNLLSNAVKFTSAGFIKVYAVIRNGMMEIGVEDSGTGIAVEDQGRLFHSFSRIGNHKNEVGSTGLGLAICRKIIERHGGTIGVRSTPEKGSTFYFTLPLAHSKETLPA